MNSDDDDAETLPLTIALLHNVTPACMLASIVDMYAGFAEIAPGAFALGTVPGTHDLGGVACGWFFMTDLGVYVDDIESKVLAVSHCLVLFLSEVFGSFLIFFKRFGLGLDERGK